MPSSGKHSHPSIYCTILSRCLGHYYIHSQNETLLLDEGVPKFSEHLDISGQFPEDQIELPNSFDNSLDKFTVD